MEQNNAAVETSVIVCKKCNQEKTRYLVGKFDSYNKKWADAPEKGRLFNGKTCPSCHSAKVKENMRVLRSVAKNVFPNS